VFVGLEYGFASPHVDYVVAIMRQEPIDHRDQETYCSNRLLCENESADERWDDELHDVGDLREQQSNEILAGSNEKSTNVAQLLRQMKSSVQVFTRLKSDPTFKGSD
jgi:hypothetical protein